jgi:hypothetical protein
MTSEEMQKIGMIDRNGYWIGSEMPNAAIVRREIFNANEMPATTVAGKGETLKFEATA